MKAMKIEILFGTKDCMIQIHKDNLEFFVSRRTKYQNYARKSS